MCEQCLVAPVYFGEPLPGWHLARARADNPAAQWRKGEWGLFRVDDPTFRWRSTPTPAPDWGMSETEADVLYDALEPGTVPYRRVFDVWEECADFFAAFDSCRADDGFEVITAAMKVGYDRDASPFGHWFFDYLGEYLSSAEPEYDDDSWFRERIALPIDETIGKAPLPGEPYFGSA